MFLSGRLKIQDGHHVLRFAVILDFCSRTTLCDVNTGVRTSSLFLLFIQIPKWHNLFTVQDIYDFQTTACQVTNFDRNVPTGKFYLFSVKFPIEICVHNDEYCRLLVQHYTMSTLCLLLLSDQFEFKMSTLASNWLRYLSFLLHANPRQTFQKSSVMEHSEVLLVHYLPLVS